MAPTEQIHAAKAALRLRMKSLRKALAEPERRQAGERLAGLARAISGALPPGIAAGYVAIRSEIDPMPLMRALAEDGWRLALPRIEGEALSFRAFSAGDRLACGGFGLTEPQPDAPRIVPDLVLVPLLAFDRGGNRLGYGRGYYDRALAALSGSRSVGLAYGAQEVGAVPVTGHDRRLSAVATENGLIDCTG